MNEDWDQPRNKYRCNYCGKVGWRYSTKRWIKSWCEETEKNVRLWRVDGGSMSGSCLGWEGDQ